VVVAGLFILTLLQISNCLKPKTSTLTREEIIQMIADMPNQPVRGGLRRSDSMSGKSSATRSLLASVFFYLVYKSVQIGSLLGYCVYYVMLT